MWRTTDSNRYRWVWLLMTLILLWPYPVQAQAPAIQPQSLSLRLAAGQCQTQQVQINTPPAPPPKLDLFFVVDITNSMQSVIDQVAQGLPTLVRNLGTVIPDTAIGLATVADYPAPGRSAGIEPWATVQPLSNDAQLMQQHLNQIRLFSSGDPEEAYLRALYETQFLAWRPDSRRVVILLGDAPVHDPDPGRDAVFGTADDLTEAAVVAQLQAANITVLATSRRKPTFFTTVTEATGGQFIILSNLTETPEIIQQLLTDTISRIHTLDFRVPTARTSWVKWKPQQINAVRPGDSHTFRLEICAPQDQASGSVTFSVLSVADGVSLGQLVVTVMIPEPTPTATTEVLTVVPTSAGRTATPTASPSASSEMDQTAVIPATLLPAQTEAVGNNQPGRDAGFQSTGNQANPETQVGIFSGIQQSFVLLFSMSETPWRVVFFILLPFSGLIWAYIYEHVIDR